MPLITLFFFFFFFNDTATTEIYTLSLHDALPIYHVEDGARGVYLGEGVVDGLLGSHIHFQHRDLRRTELFEFLGEFVEPRLAPRPNHYLGLATSSQPSEVLAQARRGPRDQHPLACQHCTQIHHRLLASSVRRRCREVSAGPLGCGVASLPQIGRAS